jgi:hypothetical protein
MNLRKAKQQEEEEMEKDDDETAKNTQKNQEIGQAKDEFYTDSDSDSMSQDNEDQ